MRSHLLSALRRFWRPTKKLTPRQLQTRLAQPETPLVLDVRTPEEFHQGHIAGAMLLPVDELEQTLPALAPHQERPIVTV
jgi:rhodanese-related sulfurtransferase